MNIVFLQQMKIALRHLLRKPLILHVDVEFYPSIDSNQKVDSRSKLEEKGIKILEKIEKGIRTSKYSVYIIETPRGWRMDGTSSAIDFYSHGLYNERDEKVLHMFADGAQLTLAIY